MSPKGVCMPSNARQFSELPCPCTMCKNRAIEQRKIRAQEIANSKNGICGQCINGTCIGKPTDTNLAPFSHAGEGFPFEEDCDCSTANGSLQGPGQCSIGPVPRSPRYVPGGGGSNCICVDDLQGLSSGMGPRTRPGLELGCYSGKGPEMGPRMYSGKGPGPSPGMDSRIGSEVMCRRSSGMVPDMVPEMGLRMGPRKSSGMAPGIRSGMGSGIDSVIGTEMITGISRNNRQSSQSSDPKEGNYVAFGGMVFGRQSSVSNDSFRATTQHAHGCSSSIMWTRYGSDSWGNRYNGRDTFDVPVHLQGNNGVLSPAADSMCSDTVCCDTNCGSNTGCTSGCKDTHAFDYIPSSNAKSNPGGGGRGGRGGNPENYKSNGIRVCSNEYINMIVTFLMEVLGILVFFAVCTFTFWITVGYYTVQLVIDLKNADRYVQVAIGIAVGLLVVAFFITIVTHGDCCNAHANLLGSHVAQCNKCGNIPTVSKCTAKPKPRPKPKPIPKIVALPPKPVCKSKPKPQVKPQVKSSCKASSRRAYSDLEGRAIFDSSKRNAILIEMKQPPTWILWARDSINSYLGRG